MKNQSFPRRLAFAFAGLRAAWRTESSFKVHVAATFAAFGALLFWKPAPLWWAIVTIVVATVVAAELVNTAIEHLADRLHPEQHPWIQVSKDCAAGAVLVATAAALGVAAAFVYDLLR